MPVPILLYHHIGIPPSSGIPGRSNYVTPQKFEKQMMWLSRLGFKGVSLREGMPYLRGEKTGKIAIITFDDGFLSVYQYAMPVLNRLGFTATNFFVAERMGLDNAWDNVKAQRDKIMTFDEMRVWAQHGHEVGSHTLTHPHLTEIPLEQAEREIILSKTMIEDALGETIHSFAYPYGDENDIVRQLVAKAGYKFAVTTQKGRARGSENDYELPRHSIRRNDTILHFLAKCLCR